MKHIRKEISLFLSVLLVLCAFVACDQSGSPVPPESTDPATDQPQSDSATDDSQTDADFTPILRFAVASDIHITTEDAPTAERTKQMLTQMDALAASGESGYQGLDAVAIVGDIADTGVVSEWELTKRIVDDNLTDGAQLLITMGNHDYLKNAQTCRSDFNRIFGQNASRHTVIGGYHFITVSVDGKGYEYSASTQQWLTKELKAAYEDGGPDKPIFVFQHIGNVDTVAGTCDHMQDSLPTLSGIMNMYPNIVNFSGHTHWAINDECAIYQDNYTAVATGTLHYSTRTKLGDGWIDMPDRHNIAQNWVVEVDASNRVRLRVWDVLQGKFVGDAFLLDSYKPKDFIYTADRFKAEDLFFAEDAEIGIINVTAKTLHVRFPQVPAESLTGRVYKLEVTDSRGTVVKEQYAGVEFFNEQNETPIVASIGGLKPDKTYTLKVYAANSLYCWELEESGTLYSKPLTLEFRTAKADADDGGADVLDVVIDARNRLVYDTSALELPVTVFGAPTFSHDDSIGMDVLTFPGDEYTNNAVKFSGYTEMASEMRDSMTFECYFKINQLPEGRYRSVASAQQGGGFGLDVYRDGSLCKFHFHDGSAYRSIAFAIELGRYYHIAAVFDGSAYILYVDGEKVGETALSSSLGFPPDSAKNIFMGSDTTMDGGCEAASASTIALLRVYSRDLDADEVLENYNALQALKKK